MSQSDRIVRKWLAPSGRSEGPPIEPQGLANESVNLSYVAVSKYDYNHIFMADIRIWIACSMCLSFKGDYRKSSLTGKDHCVRLSWGGDQL